MKPQELGTLISQIAVRSDLSHDRVLTVLREHGLTISEAIKAARQLFHISLGDAKAMVTRHPHWQQIHEEAKALHDDARYALSGQASTRHSAHS